MNNPTLTDNYTDLEITEISLDATDEQLPPSYASIYCTIAPTNDDACLKQLTQVINHNERSIEIAHKVNILTTELINFVSQAAITVYCTSRKYGDNLVYRISFRRSGDKFVKYKISKGFKTSEKEADNVS